MTAGVHPVLMVVAAWLVSGCADEIAQSQGAIAAEVVVGVTLPYTGAFAGAVEENDRNQRLALKFINDSGGALGMRLSLDARDDALDVERLRGNLSDLIDDGVKYVLTYAFGATLRSHLERAVPAGVVTMSTLAESPMGNGPEHLGMLFRGAALRTVVEESIAARLVERGHQRLALVHGDVDVAVEVTRYDFLRDSYLSLCPECETLELKAPDNVGGQLGWEGIAREVVDGDFVVYLLLTPESTVGLIRALDTLGYAQPYYIENFTVAGELPQFFRPEVVSRFRYFEQVTPLSSSLEAHAQKYEGTYGEALVPEHGAQVSADFMALVALAVVHAETQDGAAVAASMHAVSGPPGIAVGLYDYAAAVEAIQRGEDIDYEGLSGTMDFDSVGDLVSAHVREYRMSSEGKVELVE